MPLSNLQIAPIYKSKDCNVIKNFYVPVLSQSKHYDRVSAYFDSKILSLYASGIEHIYMNGGKIRFIFSYDISESDYRMMVDGYSNKDKIEKELKNKISSTDIDIDFSNLAYLVSVGIVEIKIAFTSPGIFHDKYGLMYDDEDNYLYFRGSNNETIAAILNNYESFETTTSWDCSASEKFKINSAINDFENLWQNRKHGVIVKEIPDCVKEKIISYSKGKIVLSFTENPYAFILDLNEKNVLIGKNNLSDEYFIYMIPETLFYKRNLSRYIDQINQNIYLFKDSLSYVEVKLIIDSIIKYSEKYDFPLSVSRKLLEYIKNCDIEIEKRRSLGIAIKNRSYEVKDAYNHFKNIVDNELERKLRDVQMWDSFHISTMIRSANFSVPGSGKTSIVYGAFAYLSSSEINKVDKLVVIGPKNSFMSWKDEFVLNFGDKRVLKCIDIQSDEYSSRKDKYTALKYESENANLILVNYESLEGYMDAINCIINDRIMLVFDEIHKVKAINGERAKCALQICKKANYKVGLTGTPIPNSYTDIYNLLHILFPDEYETFFKFDVSYLQNASKSIESIEKINDAIYPFFCRITKDDLGVPVAEDDNLDFGYIEMNDDEKKLMRIIHRRCKGNILLKYIRLLQASSIPELILNQNASEVLNINIDEKFYNDEHFTPEEQSFIKSMGRGRKITKGIELIDKLISNNHSVICWCVFVDTIKYLVNTLNDNGISVACIYGATSNKERDEIIRKFKNGEIQVLVTNPHTLAESVSLHKNCHYAIYFEYTFNLVHMLQSRDRIHRLGLNEDQKTYYYYMVLNGKEEFYNAIDLRTYERLKEKELIQKQAIENNEIAPLTENMIDDIKAILN